MITIKKRLAAGETVRVMFMGALASPKLAEMAGLFAGVHGLWFDQEHTALPQERLELLALACRATGIDCFVRVAPTDYTAIMRPLEAGAGGVMAAQIRSLEQAEQVLRWSKYPPQGTRGLFSGNYESRYATAQPALLVEEANRDRWIALQIETEEALQDVERIARLPGLDCLFVGPNDLACALGVPGEAVHPRCLDALRRISAAAAGAGLPWGVLARSPEHAAVCRELGCRLFSLMGDIDVVHKGFEAARAMYQEFF